MQEFAVFQKEEGNKQYREKANTKVAENAHDAVQESRDEANLQTLYKVQFLVFYQFVKGREGTAPISSTAPHPYSKSTNIQKGEVVSLFCDQGDKKGNHP